MSEDIRIKRGVTIPARELSFRFTPSGGPGGQHANRSSTRVELVWNVAETAALRPRQRERVIGNLRHRIDADGDLRVVSDRDRSQTRNRAAAIERLRTLVDQALVPPKKRVATKPSRAAKERRLQAKKRRSETKRLRRVDL